MPSHEEYLDNLLKGVIDETSGDFLKNAGKSDMDDLDSLLQSVNEELESEGAGLNQHTSGEPDMSDMESLLQSAGEEDIERLLQESQEAFGQTSGAGGEDTELSEDDLMTLLGDPADSDLQEIQELLQKSDNNEAVDESALSSSGAAFDGDNLLLGEDSQGEDYQDDSHLSKREKKAAERKRKREEKKEAKRLAKEAKKAAKMAKAEKKGKSKTKGTAPVPAMEMDQESESGQESEIEGEMDAFLNEVMKETADTGEQGSAYPEETAPEVYMLGGEDSADVADDEDAATLDAALEEMKDNDQDKGMAKKGFFARIMDFLTEEDEEENENVKISDENKAILDEMDQEDGKGAKKGKKGKKAKKDKKDKKEKKDKPKKEKKPKKPKKEKPPKQPKPDDGKPLKKLPRKPIILIGVFCLSLTAIVYVGANLLGDYNVRNEGTEAYKAGDYKTAYQNFFGRELDEDEEAMYRKSECILRIRLLMSEYELLVNDGDRVRALDSLIQTMNEYPDLHEYAIEWDSEVEVAEVYERMVAILSAEYHLTVEQALEIAAEPDDVEYTRMVTAIAEGETYTSGNTAGNQEQEAEAPLQDPLPEEESIEDMFFIDNNR